MKYVFFLSALVACVAAECDHGALYANSEDCSTFYQCAFGNLFLFSCNEGLTYNPPLERCDYPSEDDACQLSKRSAARADVQCSPFDPEGEDELLPNPDSCNSFFKCDPSGVPVLVPCPPGLEFNPVEKVCDYPQDAGCSVRK